MPLPSAITRLRPPRLRPPRLRHPRIRHPRRRPARRRRLPTVLAVTVAALVAGYLAAVSYGASAADTLLSQGRPATASSTENVGTPASAAVDGNAGTRWSSSFGDPQWLQVDLGSVATLSQVVLSWETAYATAYQVQVSADGVAWSGVYSTTTGAGGTQTLPVTGTGRYVRVLGTARATQYGYSLWEFAVHTVGGDPPRRRALRRRAPRHRAPARG
mgnify:CR=1 FL=1